MLYRLFSRYVVDWSVLMKYHLDSFYCTDLCALGSSYSWSRISEILQRSKIFLIEVFPESPVTHFSSYRNFFLFYVVSIIWDHYHSLNVIQRIPFHTKNKVERIERVGKVENVGFCRGNSQNISKLSKIRTTHCFEQKYILQRIHVTITSSYCLLS